MARSNPFAGRSHTSSGAMKETRGLLTVQVDAPGLDEMIAKLQKFAKIGDTDAKRVRAGMRKTVKIVKGQAEETVPYRTGRLKTSLFGKTKIWAEGNATGNVGSGWTFPQVLIPMTLEGGRKPNKAGHMGMAPRRWLYHAYKKVADQVDFIWRQVLEQITADLAGKG